MSSKSKAQRSESLAFTLIEIMIVVGIMGIILTMGVPIVYRVFHRPPMAQAIADVVEVCSNARSRAILFGREVDVVWHPLTGRFEVSASSGGSSSGSVGSGARRAGSGGSANPAVRVPAEVRPTTSSGSGTSAQLSEKLYIEMLDVNLTEYKDQEIARVRFYPNGTCDEFTLILHGTDPAEWKKISVEVTTGIVSVENVR